MTEAELMIYLRNKTHLARFSEGEVKQVIADLESAGVLVLDKEQAKQEPEAAYEPTVHHHEVETETLEGTEFGNR